MDFLTRCFHRRTMLRNKVCGQTIFISDGNAQLQTYSRFPESIEGIGVR